MKFPQHLERRGDERLAGCRGRWDHVHAWNGLLTNLCSHHW